METELPTRRVDHLPELKEAARACLLPDWVSQSGRVSMGNLRCQQAQARGDRRTQRAADHQVETLTKGSSVQLARAIYLREMQALHELALRLQASGNLGHFGTGAMGSPVRKIKGRGTRQELTACLHMVLHGTCVECMVPWEERTRVSPRARACRSRLSPISPDGGRDA